MDEIDIIQKQMEVIEKSMDSVKRWRTFSICLMIVVIVLLASLATSVIYYERVPIKGDKSASDFRHERLHQREPTHPSVFRDLTTLEFESLHNYLFKNMSLVNLISNGYPTLDSSFLFSVDYNLPSKSEVLEYLDNDGTKPPREAKVVLFRGDKLPPVVEEYIIGPLPNIQYHRLMVSKHHQEAAPYLFRPASQADHVEVLWLLSDIDRVLKYILEESFDASFFDCENKCLVMKHWTPVSPAVSGQDKRRVWYWAHYDVEYYLLNPVDFFVLFNLDGSDRSLYHAEEIWYAGQKFETAAQLLDAYNDDTITKSSVLFPNGGSGHFSTANLRGDPVPLQNMRKPIQVEPDGRRYEVQDRHVHYMDWDFDFRMSTITGPQLFDIQYKNRRIVYELSLQEISVFHSGYKPWNRFSNIIFSGHLMGYNAKTLVPGLDCPATSHFTGTTHWVDGKTRPEFNERTFCIFEHDSGIPLRRHHSYSRADGAFHSSLQDIVLVLRTILVLDNYDYVVDFMFHYNGAVEVRTTLTGYMMAMVFSPEESRYGFQLKDEIIGNINQHNLHFKVDIDINGVKNRYETLDFESHTVDNQDFSKDKNARYEQLKFYRDMKMTELLSVHQRNFTAPKYHIFYNKIYKTMYNDPRAYRIHINGGAAQLLSQDSGNEGAISWSRYQLAVSQYKVDELHSSSIYAMWDHKEPMVKFQSFIDDNENIIDKDLVAWVTLGVNHLPHMEDLPLITSTGNVQSFYITPFNLFDEDPSMNSRDAMRISLKQSSGSGGNIDIIDHGLPKDFVCNANYHGEFSNLFSNLSSLFGP